MVSTPDQILEFLQSIRRGTHLVLLHENSEYARGIEFEFLHGGLKKGDHCVYASMFDEPVEIRERMESFGIDVERYEERNYLRLHKVSIGAPAFNDGGLTWSEVLSSSTSSSSSLSHYRLVGRLYSPQLMTREHLTECMRIEGQIQKSSSKWKGITLCSYSMKALKPESISDWFATILKSHDGVVFAPSPGNGGAFYMR